MCLLGIVKDGLGPSLFLDGIIQFGCLFGSRDRDGWDESVGVLDEHDQVGL